MITVWGRATSSNVQVVMWTAAELDLEVDRIDAGGSFGGTDTAEYRAMNPNGLVPVFKDDDVILFESAAILRYLGAKHGPETFWPHDPAQRAKLDVWAEWSKSTLYPVLMGQIFMTLVRTPSAQRDAGILSSAAQKIAILMGHAESRLANGDFLGGNSLCFADIVFGHMLYRYFTLEFERPDLPNIKSYYERLCQRPHYQEHVMVDYSPLQVT